MQGIKVVFVAAGSAACHSIIGDAEGRCYAWGRNNVRLQHSNWSPAAQAWLGPKCPAAGVHHICTFVLPFQCRNQWASLSATPLPVPSSNKTSVWSVCNPSM